jgi:Domain of unknown function (DUF932)
MAPKVNSITTREDLFRVRVPEATESYAPVPHRKVVELTMEELDKAGFKVLSEEFYVGRNGLQARGNFQLKTKDKDMHINLAWINSYDKTIPLGWAVGGHVIVCGNGMIVGDMGRFKRRHTGTVLTEYQEAVRTHIGEAGKTFDDIIKQRRQLKNIEIGKRERAELIGRMFIEEKVLTATQLGIIQKEIENPSFGDYGAPGSVWELYNHSTVGMKADHPSLYLDHHIRFHKFFQKEFNLG